MNRKAISVLPVMIILLIGFGVGLYYAGFFSSPINGTTPTTTTGTTPTSTTTTTTTTTTLPPSLLDIITTRGSIIVGTSSGWLPYEMINSTTSELEGFDIDLVEMIADYLNVTVDWIDMDFDALVGSCLTGTIDMIAAATPLTPERAEVLAPSIPYIYANGCLVAKSDSLLVIEDLTELEGYDVGVLVNTAGDYEISDLIDSGYSINLHRYVQAGVLFADLNTSLLDAVYVELPSYTIYNETYSLKFLLCIDYPPTVLYCQQESTDLLEVIDLVISDARSDGRLEALIVKWFS
ncbi:MAG: ABC transporter substrate-binding protein [Promethearchaeota archaeon]